MSETLDHLRSGVAAIVGAADSAKALIAGLVERLRAIGDISEVNVLADELEAKAAELSEAVAAVPPVVE